MPKRIPSIKGAITASFLLAVSLPFLGADDPALPYDAKSLITSKTPAIVFNGDDSRLRAGIDMYLNGHTETLLIVGGYKSGTLEFAKASLCWQESNCKQSDLSGIKFEDAINTEDSARRFVSWLRDQYPEGQQAVIITSDYHMERTLQLIRRNAGEDLNLLRYDTGDGSSLRVKLIEGAKRFATSYGLGGIDGYQITSL